MIDTVLCIGASTYSEETPEKINEALTSSRFLEKGSVILAFHLYFVLYSAKNGIIEYPPNHVFNEQDLNDLKACIQTHHFPDCKLVFVDSEGQYPVKQGYIYILPDSFWLNIGKINSRFPALQAFPDEVDDNLVIQCFDQKNTDSYSEYSNCVNHNCQYPYLPSIDFTMEKLANSKISNKLGLILAGMEQDGVKGLISIGLKGGKIAIQNPYEYSEYKRRINLSEGNRDMPKAAISEAEKNNIEYELISLYGEINSKSLTDWLGEQLS